MPFCILKCSTALRYWHLTFLHRYLQSTILRALQSTVWPRWRSISIVACNNGVEILRILEPNQQSVTRVCSHTNTQYADVVLAQAMQMYAKTGVSLARVLLSFVSALLHGVLLLVLLAFQRPVLRKMRLSAISFPRLLSALLIVRSSNQKIEIKQEQTRKRNRFLQDRRMTPNQRIEKDKIIKIKIKINVNQNARMLMLILRHSSARRASRNRTCRQPP